MGFFIAGRVELSSAWFSNPVNSEPRAEEAYPAQAAQESLSLTGG